MNAECVYTTGVFVDKDGYPRVKWKKKGHRLNRLIYTLVNGEIPEGYVIGHSCNNKGCINPHHLYMCTPKENSSHAARDGLYKTGFKNKALENATLHWKEICRLYYDENYSQQRIGDMYGISQSRVSDIVRKYVDAHLSGDNR